MILHIKKIIKRLLLLIIPRIRGVSVNDIRMLEEELIFPEETFLLSENLDIFGQRHQGFSAYTCSIPAFYVRNIKDAKVIVGREEVFTSEDKVIIEFTSQKINPWIGSNKLKLNKSYKINARVAQLSLSGLESNYYHWLTEYLGRYYLLEKSNFKPDFYLLSDDLSFQKSYIELLEIDQNKILRLDPNTVIQADELIIPSLINNWEPINFRGYESAQKQWLPSWIGNIYREKTDLQKSSRNGNRIYISRTFASHRKVENEDEIVEILQKRGYGIYHLENMSIREQIKLFSNASIVLGAHGAGFSNIYFCPQNTVICEFFSEYYHDSGYRILANVLGLKYNYVIGQTNNIENIHPQKENIYIDIDKLKLVVKALDDLASR